MAHLDADEVRPAVSCHRLGHQGLPAARGAVQQHPAGGRQAHGSKRLRVSDRLADGEGQLLPHLTKTTPRARLTNDDVLS
jgi:hypothetical protein